MNELEPIIRVLIVILIIFGIVGINYFIFAMLRNKKGNSEFGGLLKTAASIRKPFAKEDQMLNELSQLTSNLHMDLDKTKNSQEN